MKEIESSAFSFIRDLVTQHVLLKFLLDPVLYFHLNCLCAPLSKHSLLYLLFFVVFEAFLLLAVQQMFPELKTSNATLALILEENLFVM